MGTLIMRFFKKSTKDSKGMSLNAFLKAHCSSLLPKIVEDLKKHGYNDSDMDQMLEHLVDRDGSLLLHRLLLSSPLLTAQQKIGIQNTLSTILTELRCDPLAHIIWAGKPKEDGSETIGVLSLATNMPEQVIKFYVLDKHVDHYKEKFSTLPTIQVVSIENYTLKLGITFSDGKTLTDAIKYHFDKADSQDCFNPAREYVTVVDYVKNMAQIFEGGFIIDANVIIHSDGLKKLPKPKEAVITPAYINQKTPQYDIWFFYSPRENCYPPGAPFQDSREDGTAFQSLCTFYQTDIDTIEECEGARKDFNIELNQTMKSNEFQNKTEQEKQCFIELNKKHIESHIYNKIIYEAMSKAAMLGVSSIVRNSNFVKATSLFKKKLDESYECTRLIVNQFISENDKTIIIPGFFVYGSNEAANDTKTFEIIKLYAQSHGDTKSRESWLENKGAQRALIIALPTWYLEKQLRFTTTFTKKEITYDTKLPLLAFMPSSTALLHSATEPYLRIQDAEIFNKNLDACIDKVSIKNCTLLHEAIFWGNNDALKVILTTLGKINPTALNLMMNTKVEVPIENSEGATKTEEFLPLALAEKLGRKACVELLVDEIKLLENNKDVPPSSTATTTTTTTTTNATPEEFDYKGSSGPH